MTNTKDWVLPNGGTFLASTAGIHGTWAKATDPVTAAERSQSVWLVLSAVRSSLVLPD